MTDDDQWADALRELFEEMSLELLNHRLEFHRHNLVNPGLKVEDEISVISGMCVEIAEIVRQIHVLSGASLPVIRAKLCVALFYLSEAGDLNEPAATEAFLAIGNLVRDLNRPYAKQVGTHLLHMGAIARQKNQ